MQSFVKDQPVIPSDKRDVNTDTQLTTAQMHLPVEIKQILFSYCSLESVLALSQTSHCLRSYITSEDGRLVKDKVLERVPWMVTDEDAELMTWLDCARLIVARRASRLNHPEQWQTMTSDNTYKEIMTRLYKNVDVTEVGAVDCTGGTLPDSFQPLLDGSFYVTGQERTGGKYHYLPHNSGALDMTNLEYHPDRRSVFGTSSPHWHGIGVSYRRGGKEHLLSPLSKLEVYYSQEFTLDEENDRLIVVSAGDEKIVLDKSKAFGRVLEINEHSIVARYHNNWHTQVHILPGPQGIMICRFLADNNEHYSCKFLLCHQSLSPGRTSVVLGLFPGSPSYYHRHSGVSYGELHEAASAAVVFPYSGILYLQLQGRYMIPLWVDLHDCAESNWRTMVGPSPDYQLARTEMDCYNVCIAATRQDMKTQLLCLDSASYCNPNKVGDIRTSSNKRWVTTRESRLVSDLARGKTYNVIGLAMRTSVLLEAPRVFLGSPVEKDGPPQFYMMSTKYIRSVLANIPEVPLSTCRTFLEQYGESCSSLSTLKRGEMLPTRNTHSDDRSAVDRLRAQE